MVKHKKAQEEMFGFVFIILLVTIVSLVFLSFSIKKPSSDVRESIAINDLLNSMLSFTTECGNLKELSISCYKGEYCNETTACKKFSDLSESLLDSALRAETSATGYSFYANYTSEITAWQAKPQGEIISLTNGNLTGKRLGAFQVIPISSTETIQMSLYFCY